MNKRLIAILVLVFLTVAPALGDFGDLICHWYAPLSTSLHGDCRGLAWDGKYVWCSVRHMHSGVYIFRCRHTDGSVVSSFPNPFGLYGTRGMTYRNYQGQDTLELAGWLNNLPFIFRFNFKGEVIDRKRVYTPGNESITGICFDGRDHWVTEPKSEDYSAVYKLNDGGSVIASFKMRRVGSANGIDKQGDFFWVPVDYYGPPDFYGAYKVLPNGSIAATLTDIYLTQYVYDCAYENNRLWVVSNGDEVRCYDVSNAPAVAPASLGKVKALFR